MQDRTLKRSQIETMLFMRRCEKNVFSNMPSELILEVSGYGKKENRQDFQAASHYVVYGQLPELKDLLDAKPFLVLFNGKGSSVITPGGLIDKNKALYELALAAGDPEIKTLVQGYFSRFKDGESLMKSQFEKYRPLIESIPNQRPDDDLTELFDLLIKSTLEDVAAELNTGGNHDWDYCSKLRYALNQWRANKLKPERRILEQPGMHCNYQNLVHADDLLSRNWNNLRVGVNGDKIYLASRQIIGLIELLELPAYERIIFARDQVGVATRGGEIERKSGFQFKHSNGRSFPDFNMDLINAHSGVGFDSFISMYGWEASVPGAGGLRPFVTELISSKNIKLARLAQPHLQSQIQCVML